MLTTVAPITRQVHKQSMSTYPEHLSLNSSDDDDDDDDGGGGGGDDDDDDDDDDGGGGGGGDDDGGGGGGDDDGGGGGGDGGGSSSGDNNPSNFSPVETCYIDITKQNPSVILEFFQDYFFLLVDILRSLGILCTISFFMRYLEEKFVHYVFWKYSVFRVSIRKVIE
jgi:hypothetical protein